MAVLDTCASCLAPYTLTCSVLLFVLAHLLTSGSWTFEVLAAKHRWDVKQKARCCRNAAIFYLCVSFLLASCVWYKSIVQRFASSVWLKVAGRRRRRAAEVRAALLGRRELGRSRSRRGSRGWADGMEEDEEEDTLVGARNVQEMAMPLPGDASGPGRLQRGDGGIAVPLFSGATSPQHQQPRPPPPLAAATTSRRRRVWADSMQGPTDAATNDAASDALYYGWASSPRSNAEVVVVGDGDPGGVARARGRSAIGDDDDEDFASDIDARATMVEQRVLRQRAFARLHRGDEDGGGGGGGGGGDVHGGGLTSGSGTVPPPQLWFPQPQRSTAVGASSGGERKGRKGVRPPIAQQQQQQPQPTPAPAPAPNPPQDLLEDLFAAGA